MKPECKNNQFCFQIAASCERYNGVFLPSLYVLVQCKTVLLPIACMQMGCECYEYVNCVSF